MLQNKKRVFTCYLPSYLASIQKGEEICITSHGRIIAHIVPPIDQKKTASKKLAALRKQACIVGDVISPIEEQWNDA